MNSENPTLLIVEDDDNDFLFLERSLAMANLEADIRRACDGNEAIDYLAGANASANRELYPLPELMVLDLKMPRKNGFEVLAWLREQPDLGSLPVVVFSSSEEPADVERSFDYGASAYLVKPSSYLSYSEVVQTLKQFLLDGVGHDSRERGARTYYKRLK